MCDDNIHKLLHSAQQIVENLFVSEAIMEEEETKKA